MQMVFNWHITEKCNFKCHYCFAEWEKNSEIWENEIESLKLISEISHFNNSPTFHGFKKPVRINFAGGEPLVIGRSLLKYLEMTKSAGLETSIITNGSLLKENIEIVDSLDMLGISVDSFDKDENFRIGRNCGKSVLSYETLQEIVHKARERKPDLKIKFNTVVNRYNWHSDVVNKLHELGPYKIKIFRQLPFRDQRGISESQFSHFVTNNSKRSANIVVENNSDMINSYLMIDPAGCFFQNGDPSKYYYSQPIQLVGIDNALSQVRFNDDLFKNRYVGVENVQN